MGYFKCVSTCTQDFPLIGKPTMGVRMTVFSEIRLLCMGSVVVQVLKGHCDKVPLADDSA